MDSSNATSLALLAVLACPGLAQDSTSNSVGLPGDPVDPHLAAEQVNDFVVDLTVHTSSWGGVYGVAPLVKASASYLPAPQFFNAQVSAQAISTETLVGVPFARGSYAFWDVPGAGVNDDPTLNDPPTGSIDTSNSVGNQFGVAFAEFSSDDAANPTISFNNVVTAVVDYDLGATSRLYVSRVVAAVNSPDWTCNLSQYGMGGVDNAGLVHFRADGFGSAACQGFTELQSDNYFQVDSLARNAAARNVISNAGGSDAGATSWLLIGSTTTHATPTIIPGSVTGGLPILMGSNFSGQYVFGDSFPLSASTLHLGTATDHRGQVSHTQRTFSQLPGSLFGTGATLGKSGSPTDQMALWGIGAGGFPAGNVNLVLPAVITDNDDGWPSNTLGAGQLQFGHYFSQAPFRGGNGQVAMGEDQAGRLLAAAVVLHPQFVSGDQGNNLIAVARATGASVEWTMAGYTENANGKAIYDSNGANVIGHLTSLNQISTLEGPSLTSPMIDSVGNVYFLAPIDLTSTGGGTGVGLLRAVYDATAFSYRLDLVLRTGDVLHGPNSDRDYQIRFMTIADSNSIDSGTCFSGNINQDAHNAADPAGLSSTSTEALGGLVLNVDIIYDINGDGLFEDLSTNPSTPDQEYNSLLYVAHAKDCNGNGVPDDLDIIEGTSTDNDGDGVPDECAAGTPYCFGDGSGTTCPCGNFGGSGEGCANSSGSGAYFFSTGSPSVSADDLGFDAFNLLPGQPALLFVGENQVNGGNGVVFGDGLRCAGFNVVRLGVRVPDGNGQASWGPGMGAQGGWSAGDTRNFQVWYRDPGGSPCGAGFNLSHGLSVVFVP